MFVLAGAGRAGATLTRAQREFAGYASGQKYNSVGRLTLNGHEWAHCFRFHKHLELVLHDGAGGTLTPIKRIVSAKREELEREIGELKDEAERIAEEARELAGEVPF